ncbi:MAG: transaldolase / glucose-6-phosphate isomerase [Chloroflexota bacterium]|jgi:glucose-6-phosphate isomerase|nr:transaldolase / glucose-6-phosphate isomerase [Chloroflexota bacterium]MEA2605908.1 transaldolase / glucose-6-phosphate isomerase [Chloroflexota bacterium]
MRVMPDDTTSSPTFASPDLSLGADRAAFDALVRRARDEQWAERIWDRDPTLWSTNERVQAAIADRLGWLDAPAHFAEQVAALEGFGEGVRDSGFTTAVVGGMGGSSLAPDVFHRTFGTADGWLDLRVLDSTDPAAVAATVDDLDPLATLWIVASKSGTTTEPLAFQADAWDRAERALRSHHAPRNEHAGELVIAITDPGKSVEAIPHHDDLREVFLNPPDIGGRYSALTYVGLVPASLIGLDLDALLASAQAMAGACHDPEPSVNPGVSLGLAIGTLAVGGRDKLTFIADPSIESFGSWAEQLIAESTGKHGTGIVPIDREPLGEISTYGSDRVFVRLSIAGDDHPAGDALVEAAAAAGHPVIRIGLADPIDIGAEAFRWEFATAIAGAVLGIDPFDQPNVEEAKDLTRKVLAAAESGAQPAPPPPALVVDAGTGLTLHGDASLRLTAGDGTLVGELARHLARRKSNAYLALQAFIEPSDATAAALSRIRALLRDATHCATTAGFGPRFLHSTGQLHKGGTPSGWFLQLTADHPVDRPIPGWPYTFGRLIDAQAEGDFAAIESHELPILRVHLADPERGLAALEAALHEALAPS